MGWFNSYHGNGEESNKKGLQIYGYEFRDERNPRLVFKKTWLFSNKSNFALLSSLRFAVDLIIKKRQLVIFPEGKINKYGKKLSLKQGLFRLAVLATKKTTSITIIPVGIAYSEVTPKFRSRVSLCFGEPLIINKKMDLSINEFNETLHKKMTIAENEALKNVGR